MKTYNPEALFCTQGRSTENNTMDSNESIDTMDQSIQSPDDSFGLSLFHDGGTDTMLRSTGDSLISLLRRGHNSFLSSSSCSSSPLQSRSAFPLQFPRTSDASSEFGNPQLGLLSFIDAALKTLEDDACPSNIDSEICTLDDCLPGR